MGPEEELRDSAGESHGRTDLPADGPSHRDTESGKIFQNGEKYQNRRQPNGKSSWYPAGQKPGSKYSGQLKLQNDTMIMLTMFKILL